MKPYGLWQTCPLFFIYMPDLKPLILLPFLRFLVAIYLTCGLWWAPPPWVLVSPFTDQSVVKVDLLLLLLDRLHTPLLPFQLSLFLICCQHPCIFKKKKTPVLARSFANKLPSRFLSGRGCRLIQCRPSSLLGFLRSLLHLRHFL